MTIREVLNHGQRRWRVDFGKRDGRRRVEFFKTRSEANTAADASARDAKAIGRQWARLTARQRGDVGAILREIESHGLTLRQVWSAYQAERMRPVDPLKRRTLQAAVTELLAAKRTANRRDNYIESLETYLGKFIHGREQLHIDRITAADIAAWFDGRNEAPTTRASNMGRLSSLFGYCARQGYIPSNPCEALESITIDAKLPAILTVPQAAKFLNTCATDRPDCLAYFTLGVFDGPRPDAELKHVDWKDISLREKRVKLHRSKRRKPRILQLSESAAAWLKLCPKKKGPITPARETVRRARRYLRDKLKIKWHQDILRKTAASYQLALTGDLAAVAYKLGTSERMLARWYIDGLVTKKEAEAFYAIRPTAGTRSALRARKLAARLLANQKQNSQAARSDNAPDKNPSATDPAKIRP